MWKFCILLCLPTILCIPAHKEHKPQNKRADEVPGRMALDNFPLIDGHNDLPFVLRITRNNQIEDLDFYNLTNILDCAACKHTDINKLRAGKVGAQFWVAYAQCNSQFKDAVDHTLEQIDVIKRFVKKYPDEFQLVTNADGILAAFKNKKIGSLLAVEGGHLIGDKLSVLRMYYELGVRYLTLTHTCNTPWADASPLDTQFINNVTDFGKKIVLEMNRLGMMVDVSHVSYGTMYKVIKVSRAPVIFSHSSSYTVHHHHRNVRDDVLHLLKENKGVIMVNFYPDFVGEGNVTIDAVATHIEHIVDICGIDCVGIGADFCGVSEVTTGLEDVSKYPDLFDLLRTNNPSRWSIKNLEKLAGRNLVRVFKDVEKVRDSLINQHPEEIWISEEDLNKYPEDTKACKTVPIV